MKKLLSCCVLFLCGVVNAFPDRPIKIIVPFQTGGPTDQVARIVSNKLETRLKVPIIVENKPGASASIGIDQVAKSPSDGYTLLLSSSSFIINHYFSEKLPYDASKDFSHIILISQIPQALIVSNNSKIKTVQELIAYAEVNPNKVTYGSNGVGTANYLDAEIFSHMTNVKLFHVPYKGQTAVIADILSGSIDMAFVSVNNAVSLAKTGKLTLLAVTSRQRTKSASEYPTLHESGVRNFNSISWFGLTARAGTPESILSFINNEVNKVLADPDVIQKIEAIGGDVVGGSRQKFQDLIKTEHEKYALLHMRLKK